MKSWLRVLATGFMLLALPAGAAELPDFGSPADAAMSKSREAQIGRSVMLQLRNAGAIVDDPFLNEYLTTLGSRLATHANDGDFSFNFFVVNDDAINAFALPGGYIGVNAGLYVGHSAVRRFVMGDESQERRALASTSSFASAACRRTPFRRSPARPFFFPGTTEAPLSCKAPERCTP